MRNGNNRKEDMAGEVVTGAVQGVALATEAVRAPVAVAASIGTGAASMSSMASVTAETSIAVAQGLEGMKSTIAPLGEALNTTSQSTLFASKLSVIAQTGDSHSTLTMLAFGDMYRSPERDAVAQLPEHILQQDFIDLEKVGPQAAQGLTKEVEGLSLPKDLVDNPDFLAAFAREFGTDIAVQKDLLKSGKLSAEDYLAMRQSMLEKSAQKASRQTEEPQEQPMTEKQLEELKRKAALDAIRQHMQKMRLSVMTDKRLTPDAKQHALRRLDLFERKVLIKEVMKWDGVSIMKLIALATVWAAEINS